MKIEERDEKVHFSSEVEYSFYFDLMFDWRNISVFYHVFYLAEISHGV